MSLDISGSRHVALCVTPALYGGCGQLNAMAPLPLVPIRLEAEGDPDTVWTFFMIKLLGSCLFPVSVFVMKGS